MIVTTDSVREALNALHKAQRMSEAARQNLYQSDGTPRYSPQQMQERLTDANQVLADAVAKAKKRVAEAMEMAVALRLRTGIDPIQHLKPFDLERVSRLRPFVREFCQEADLSALAFRLRAEERYGDEVSRLLHVRYAQQRLAQVRQALRSGQVEVHRPSLHDAQVALDALQAQLVSPNEVHNQAVAKELAEAADELQRAIEALFDEPVADVTIDAS